MDNREQPTLEQEVLNTDSEDSGVTKASEEVATDTASEDNGSLMGKFSSVDALMNAYNNLQAEFTRKCQQLNNLKESLKRTSGEATNSEKESVPFSTEKQAETLSEQEKINNKKELPNAESLLEKFDNFASNFPSSINYKDKIIEILKQRKDDNFEVAYQKAMLENSSSFADLLTNDDFINEILKNDNFKNEVIVKYINERNTSVPKIFGVSNSVSALANPPKCDTLKDARELVLNLLQK